jgi:hypothetical protein
MKAAATLLLSWLIAILAVGSAPAEAPPAPSVAGQAFPLSGSVRKSCDNAADKCAEAYSLLARFASEPREALWAANMERNLADYFATQGRDFSVRTLECRSSVCAAEVTCPKGNEVRPFHYGAPIDRMLQSGVGINAYERNESGEFVTVSFRLYSRR